MQPAMLTAINKRALANANAYSKCKNWLVAPHCAHASNNIATKRTSAPYKNNGNSWGYLLNGNKPLPCAALSLPFNGKFKSSNTTS